MHLLLHICHFCFAFTVEWFILDLLITICSAHKKIINNLKKIFYIKLQYIFLISIVMVYSSEKYLVKQIKNLFEKQN